MKRFNLSDWALEHRSLVWYFMIVFALAGVFSYLGLGREEDPNFTIKTMVIQALWPGASAEEVAKQVTDRIEKKLDELESLDYTKSVTTAGKTIVDMPQTMVKSILSYDNGTLFANAGLDYQSKRYYTYLNDASVDGRTLVNGSVGWRFGRLGALQSTTLQLSGVNLTNRHYVATLGSNGFVASDPTGSFQTLLPGAPRAVYLSVSAKL